MLEKEVFLFLLCLLYLLDHLQHPTGAVGGGRGLHRGSKTIAVRPGFPQGGGEAVGGHVLLGEHMAQPALFQAAGVENLVARLAPLG